jgi:uncharacterized protein (UPF0335 family)
MTEEQAPGIGHNAPPPDDNTDLLPPEPQAIAPDRLRRLVERIESLDEERRALSSDIRDVYVEAKSAGFDVKVIRALVNQRKRDPADVEEYELLLDLYRRTLGM